MKRADMKFLEEHGFRRTHSNSDLDWVRKDPRQYVMKSSGGWLAIHSTGGPNGRYWKGPPMSGPISAYVHAELENWGAP